MGTTGLRNAAIVAFVAAMAFLLIGGHFAKDKVPPIPQQVTADGKVVTDHDQIKTGQDVYQRYALMDHGSVWGHGSLRGPDFAAVSLHRLGEAMRDYYAAPTNPQPGAFEQLPEQQKRSIRLQVIDEIHENKYDPRTGVLTLNAAEMYGLERHRDFWEQQLGEGSPRYGFLPDTVPTAQERRAAADFFFWTAWAAGTDRPDQKMTYTNNWPPDVTVGNVAPAEALLWSIASILVLFGILGVVIYIVHRYEFFYGSARAVEAAQRIIETPLTPSQRATPKFFLVAGLLFLVQIFNGGLLAHYTVHPAQFYIETVGQMYAYSWAKTWHLQLAILWIATSWIGTAIYLAPMISGREPRHQKFFVNLLFVALVAVVGLSLFGEVAAIQGWLGETWYWLGHQGWEYLELGRLWQILLFAGLIFWLIIVYRAMASMFRSGPKPKDKQEADRKALILFYVFSAILIVAFFGFGLMYWRGTHISIADYWRWFVVHLWVESIFEVFGVAVVALFLVTLGLVTATSALRVAYLTVILAFFSGIPGAAHHYFWNGGPSFWLAIGSVFSSLEPIPLVLLVVRAWMEYREIKRAGGRFPYRWPLYFLTASSIWNFAGAAVFGFMINLPIINYYEHATYLTSNHAHTALFGVYGMLAISLILFSWRGLVKEEHWNDRILKISFWGLNGGLFLMFLLTLLPVGLMQVYYSYTQGFWYARSADFYELPIVQTLGFWRIVPDSVIILVGAVPLLYFLASTFPKLRDSKPVSRES